MKIFRWLARLFESQKIETGNYQERRRRMERALGVTRSEYRGYETSLLGKQLEGEAKNAVRKN